jgi:hypothetical protein
MKTTISFEQGKASNPVAYNGFHIAIYFFD